MTRSSSLFIVFLISLTCVVLLWISTVWGPGTFPDSIEQMLAAATLNSPSSLFQITSHWPPLYTVVLALGNYATGDMLVGTRGVQAIIYALNVWLFYFLLRARKDNYSLTIIIAVLCFSFANTNYYMHETAFSEALCLVFLLGHLITFRESRRRQSNAWLYASACCLSLALLTRYSSFAFIGGCCGFLLLRDGRSLLQRFRDSLFFGAIAVLPLFTYLLARALTGSAATPRKLAFHPVGWARLQDTGEQLFIWLNPEVITVYGAALAACLVVFLLGRALPRRNSDPDANFSCYLLLQSVCYILFLYLSISFFDYSTPINQRTLSPVLTLVIAAVSIAAQINAPRAATVRWITACLLVVIFISGLPNLTAQVTYNIANGDGYFSKQSRSQDLLHQLSTHQYRNIYSNCPEIINIYLDLDARSLPQMYNPLTLRASTTYLDDMANLHAQILEGTAVIVYFKEFKWREYLPGQAILTDQIELPVLFQGTSGTIYGQNVEFAKENQADEQPG